MTSTAARLHRVVARLLHAAQLGSKDVCSACAGLRRWWRIPAVSGVTLRSCVSLQDRNEDNACFNGIKEKGWREEME